MQIITDITEAVSIKEPLACAYGYFDGMHLGHMKVINATAGLGLKRAVVTFNNRPMNFINKNFSPDGIMSVADKAEFMEKAGIDYLFIFEFNEEIMSMSCEDFVEKYMSEINAREVVVGFNYTFGKNKEGNCSNIKHLCEKWGIKTHIVKEAFYGSEPISSTLIRKALYSGDVVMASQMLGRPFYIKGKINKGKQLGSKIGFPTANVETDSSLLIPKWGVYATKCTLEGRVYKGVTNVGNNPTVAENNGLSVETHIVNFSGDVYGKELKIEFLFRIRPDIKFNGVEDLVEQIGRDVKTVDEIYEI